MRLEQFLRHSTLSFHDRPAVVDQDRSITYRHLGEAVAGFSAQLRRLPINRGSRIALLMENCVDYVVAYFAVLEAGFVLVPLDTSANGETIGYILENCAVRVLIAQSRYRRQLKAVSDAGYEVEYFLCDSELPFGTDTTKKLIFGESMQINSELSLQLQDVAAGADVIELSRNGKSHELAAIFYTSGSTGKPKGVMLSHLNLISNTSATIEYLKLTKNDSTLVILPFYYIYGNSLLLTNIAAGACLVIDNRFLYPETVLNTMEEKQCTGLSGVPSNFMILLGKSTLTSRQFPHLRYFTQAGGAMAPDVTRALADAFPDKEIYIMYGQTEAAPRVTYLPPLKLTEKLGSIGIPLNGVSVSIVNEQQAEVPTGVTGELVVAGDNVMMGYWRQPDEQQEVLRDGRLFTGDLGYKDDDGYIFIVGRKKEIIKAGGNRVSVKEVEEAIVAHEKVLEACVIGVPDPLLGEAIKAFVVLKPNMELADRELQRHCQRVLADYKVPKIFAVVDNLPKYQSGKINRQLLKQQTA